MSMFDVSITTIMQKSDIAFHHPSRDHARLMILSFHTGETLQHSMFKYSMFLDTVFLWCLHFPLILYLITTAETSDDFCCVRWGTKQMACKSATKRQGSQWKWFRGSPNGGDTGAGPVSSYCSLLCVLIDAEVMYYLYVRLRDLIWFSTLYLVRIVSIAISFSGIYRGMICV